MKWPIFMGNQTYMLYKQHLGESCNVTTTFKEVLYVRMYVRVSCSPPDVSFQDTYIFLLLHVRATRKVSYMRYKQHLGESCNV